MHVPDITEPETGPQITQILSWQSAS